MKPKISIIVPVYKTEKYLERCVNSIRKQTLKEIEIILIDDGSPDECPFLCDQLAREDSRIKVIHKSNEGVSRARNLGIELANGDYIGFVDSDDSISQNMYEKLYNQICETDSDICISGHNVISGEKVIQNKLPFEVTVMKFPELYEEYITALIGRGKKGKVMGSCARCLYRKEILKDVWFREDIKLLEDTIFNIHAALKSEKICIVNECLYNYFVVAESATNRYRTDYLEQVELIISELRVIVKRLEEKNISSRENYIDTLFELVLFALKNMKLKGTTLSSKERKKNMKEIMKKNYAKEMLREYKATSFKQYIFCTLLKIGFYGLVEKLL